MGVENLTTFLNSNKSNNIIVNSGDIVKYLSDMQDLTPEQRNNIYDYIGYLGENWISEDEHIAILNAINNYKIERKSKTKKETSRLRDEIENGIDKSLITKAADFIIKHEWFSHTSYNDWKQYSRWYWTKAPWKWKYISKNDARKELIQKTNEVVDYLSMQDWFIILNENQKIALISFFYNNWQYLVNARNNHLMYRLRNWYYKAAANMMLEYNKMDWKVLNWLKNRRKAEYELFNS